MFGLPAGHISPFHASRSLITPPDTPLAPHLPFLPPGALVFDGSHRLSHFRGIKVHEYHNLENFPDASLNLIVRASCSFLFDSRSNPCRHQCLPGPVLFNVHHGALSMRSELLAEMFSRPESIALLASHSEDPPVCIFQMPCHEHDLESFELWLESFMPRPG